MRLQLPFGCGKTLTALVLALLWLRSRPERDQALCFYVTLPSLRQQVQRDLDKHLCSSAHQDLKNRIRIVSALALKDLNSGSGIGNEETSAGDNRFRDPEWGPLVVLDEFNKFLKHRWFQEVLLASRNQFPVLLMSGSSLLAKTFQLPRLPRRKPTSASAREQGTPSATDPAEEAVREQAARPGSGASRSVSPNVVTVDLLHLSADLLGRQLTEVVWTPLDFSPAQHEAYARLKAAACRDSAEPQTEPETETEPKTETAQKEPSELSKTQRFSSYRRFLQDAETLSSWKVERILSHFRGDSPLPCLPGPSRSTNAKSSCVAIFSSFPRVLAQLQRGLELPGPHSRTAQAAGLRTRVVNTASVPAERRGLLLTRTLQAVAEAGDAPELTLLLCSVHHLAHGADLGQCQCLLCIDTVYSHKDQEQLQGRLARIGQVQNQKLVFVFWRNTFEEKLLSANNDKSFAHLAL